MSTPTSTAFDAEVLNQLIAGFRRHGYGANLAALQADVVAGLADAANLASIPAPVQILTITSVTTGETRIVGDDTFEFLDAADDTAAETNIAVLIGADDDESAENFAAAVNATNLTNEHADCFNGDGTTPALANGTENLFAVAVTGGKVYLFAANAPGGVPQTGNPASLAFAGTSANTSWLLTNFTALPLVPSTKRAEFGIAVTSAILALDQPLPLRVGFEPTGARYSVRGGTNGEPKDCYVDLKMVEVGDEWIVEANLNDQAPSRTKTATLVIPVNDNDSTVIAWFLAKALRITGFRFARGETAAAALTMSVDKITASTAAVVAQLATAVDISGGTNGALQAFTPDESPAGDLPIDLTNLQGLAFTVAAGNGTVAPRAVTVHIDYVELLQDGDRLSIEVFG